MKKGIDVSEFQSNISWDKIKKDEIKFAILKYANIYDDEPIYYDSKFEFNYNNCQKLNIPIGIYIYNYCNTIENLELNINKILPKIKKMNFELPIFLDMEDKTILSEGKSYLSKMCKHFCDMIQNASYTPGIYANLDWFTNYLDVSQFSNSKVWIAQYYSKCTYNKTYMIWQYSNSR